MKSELLVPLAVVIANVAGVAVALLAPAFLPPVEYSTFALSWAVGQFLAMLCFEWLRFSALRFSAGPDAQLAMDRGAVIVATYRRLAVAVGLASLAAMLFARGNSLAATAPLALFYAVCQGTFDGRQALARAARDNIAFARDWAMRAVLCIGLVITVAWATRNGTATVVALSLSFPTALALSILVGQRRPRAISRSPLRWTELPRLVRYGGLAAVSGVIAYAMPTLIRWALVAEFGQEGAAGALLAADLAQKTLSVAGVAVNMVMIQHTFSAIDSKDSATIVQSNRKQIAWAVATVVSIGLLVWLLGADAASVLMKPAYREAFTAAIGSCALATGLICVRLFAIDPLFYGYEKSGFAVIGAAVSIGGCLVGLGLPRYVAMPGFTPLDAYWCSSAAGLLVSVTIALVVLRIQLPWSQFARLAMVVFIILLVAGVTPHFRGLAGLLTRATIFGLAFFGGSYLLDVVWLRTELLPGLFSRRGAGRSKR